MSEHLGSGDHTEDISDPIDLYIKWFETKGGDCLKDIPPEAHRSFVKKLIEMGHIDFVANTLNNFKGLDSEIAHELIKQGHQRLVVDSLRNFKDLDDEIALKVIEEGRAENWFFGTRDGFSIFKELKRETLQKICQACGKDAVFTQFPPVIFRFMRLAALEKIKRVAGVNNAKNFQNMDGWEQKYTDLYASGELEEALKNPTRFFPEMFLVRSAQGKPVQPDGDHTNLLRPAVPDLITDKNNQAGALDDSPHNSVSS